MARCTSINVTGATVLTNVNSRGSRSSRNFPRIKFPKFYIFYRPYHGEGVVQRSRTDTFWSLNWTKHIHKDYCEMEKRVSSSLACIRRLPPKYKRRCHVGKNGGTLEELCHILWNATQTVERWKNYATSIERTAKLERLCQTDHFHIFTAFGSVCSECN